MTGRIIVIVLLTSICIYSKPATPPSAAAGESILDIFDFQIGQKSTKGEKGFVMTMVSIYGKVRDGVRCAYDEVQYWRGLGECYKRTKNWFTTQRARLKVVGRTGAKLFKDPQDILGTLNEAEEFFKYTDELIFSAPAELNQIMLSAEFYIDAIGDPTWGVSGSFMPKVDEIVNLIDNQFCEIQGIESIQVPVYSTVTGTQKHIAEVDGYDLNQSEHFVYYKMLKKTTAESFAYANSYKEQAIYNLNEMNKIGSLIDTKDKEDELNNINDLQALAASHEFESININNKRLGAISEELRILSFILGANVRKEIKRADARQNVYEQGAVMSADCEYVINEFQYNGR